MPVLTIMRDPGRISPMMDLIESIWERYPDMRLGQLMFNLTWVYQTNRRLSMRDNFYIEDDDFYRWLKEDFKGF